MPDDQTLEQRARRRVGMKLGFAVHALVYVMVNLGFYLLHEATGGVRWHVFPFVGWGLGLAIHGLVVLVSLSGDGLRQRMLAREIESLKRRDAGR